MKNICKSILVISLGFALITAINPAYSKSGFNYQQKGYFFGNATMPFNAVSKESEQIPKDKLVPTANQPVHDSKVTIENLRRGESSRTNVFHLVEWGDAGFVKACYDGNIRKVHFIEFQKQKISIPFLPFIPIYVDKYITVVYGE